MSFTKHRASGGGFYAGFNTSKTLSTPSKPSFLNDSKQTLDDSTVLGSKMEPLTPSTSLFSVPSRSGSKVGTTFGSAKRKKPSEVVSKPSFKVSNFVGAAPHLPKFGSSLTKVKFDFSSRSNFYTGKTKFGGSSSTRDKASECKRVKLSPVSYRGPSNVTRVSVKPYNVENRKTLTSKTADNILLTLNKVITPSLDNNNKSSTTFQRQSFHSEFSSFSQRLREKRKFGMSSLPPPPISRLNQIKAKINDIKDEEEKPPQRLTPQNETKSNEFETTPVLPTKENIEPVVKSPVKISLTANIDDEKPTIISTSTDNLTIRFEKTDSSPLTKSSVTDFVSKQDESISVVKTNTKSNGLKMKRERTKDHYIAVSEEIEEPVNTLPEITHPEPLVVTSLPKFDFTVKPASSSLFPNISTLPKPAAVVISKNEAKGKFDFSMPKLISNRNMTLTKTENKNYSFVSPVLVKNMVSPVKMIKSNNSNSFNSNVAPSITPEKLNSMKEVDKTVDKSKSEPSIFELKVQQSSIADSKAITNVISGASTLIPSIGLSKTASGTNSGFTFGKTSPSTTTFSVASTNTVSSTGFTFSKPFITICSSGKSFGKSSQVSKTFSFASPISKSIDSVDKSNDTNTDKAITPTVSNLVNQEIKSNPFAKLKPAAGNWECPTCMISNKNDDLKCVACTEAKPGSSLKDNANLTSNNLKEPATKISQDKLSLFAKFQPAEGNWDCPTCMISNKNDDLKCVACTEPKPGSSLKDNVNLTSNNLKEPATKISQDKLSLFAKFKPAEDNWDCPTCMISNKNDDLKCVACTEPKPGSSGDAATSVSNTIFKFGSGSSSNSGFTFGSSNTSNSDLKFGSNETSNPDFKFGTNGTSNPDLKFGSNGTSNPDLKLGSSNTEKSEFKFGANKKCESDNTKKSSEVCSVISCIPNETPLDDNIDKPSMNSDKKNPFAKLKPDEDSWECPTCMISNKKEVLKCVACTEAKPGASTVSELAATPASSLFSFGSTKTEDTASKGFSFSAKQENKSNGFPSATSSENLFSAGASKKSAEINSAGFTFGATSSITSTEVSSKNTGSCTETDPSNGFSFGNVNPGFGALASDNKNSESIPVQSGFTFGSTNTSTESKYPAFGSTVATADSKFGFGLGDSNNSGSLSNVPSTGGFNFGVTTTSETKAPSSGFNFSAPGTTTSVGFKFGETSTDTEKPSGAGSIFGAAAAVSSSAGFDFGGTSTNMEKPSGTGSIFGTAASTSSSGFSFGGTSANTEKPSSTGSIFGAAVSSSSAGFNFGGTSTNIEKPTSTGSIFGTTASSFGLPKENGFPSTANNPPMFNFMANSNKPPSFLNPVDTSKTVTTNSIETPAKFNFNPSSISTPNINFGAVSNASTLFGKPNPSGQFSFAPTNGGDNGEAPKPNIFAQPAPTANLFNIGGGGSTLTNDATGERRKVKRAHRRLQRK